MSARIVLLGLGLAVGFQFLPFPSDEGEVRAAGAPRVGEYHEGVTLNCSDCHVMHPGPRPRGLEPDSPGTVAFVGGLLREDVNELCLSCHDGSRRAIDVLGVNQGRRANTLRQAGSLNRLGRDGLAGTGHTLDSLDAAPGSSPAWRPEEENGAGKGLNCINCHAPHGSPGPHRAYRNLRDDAGNNPPGAGLVTYNDLPGTNDLSRDVFVRRALRYGEQDVDFNEPDPKDSAMGRFCAGCHDLFHGSPGSPQIGGEGGGARSGFLRHPSAGVSLGGGREGASSHSLFASRANRVKMMSEIGVWDPPGRDVSPTCITCHKAHGNGNAFGLIFRSGRGVPTEDGDTAGGTLEHLCAQCHGLGPGAL
jgi:hypothetical protein